jgi:AraC-like DNA-binding protein
MTFGRRPNGVSMICLGPMVGSEPLRFSRVKIRPVTASDTFGPVVYQPSSELQHAVLRYAGINVNGVVPGIDTALPSRHIHLFISLGAPIQILGTPNRCQSPSSFAAFVCGLQDGPRRVRRGTSIELLHIFLTPLGARSILGVPSSHLTSQVIELTDLWGRDGARLIERLREAASWPARFAILDHTFRSCLQPAEMPSELTWAWCRLARCHGSHSIHDLARELRWSRRHFAERFRTHVGIPPKTAARIFRFERACRLIKEQRPRLAEVALACGFHDQAHLTREWNALAGCTPKAWIASELPFLQDHESD